MTKKPIKNRSDVLDDLRKAVDDLIDGIDDDGDDEPEPRPKPTPKPTPSSEDDSAGLGLSYESALRQVARLLKLSERAGTPEEAATAAAKAHVLMERFQIERDVAVSSLEAKERKPDEPIEHFDQERALDTELGKQLPHWRWRLAITVMHAHGCHGYISERAVQWVKDSSSRLGKRLIGGESIIAIIGRKSDVETVRYVYGYLLKECERLVDALQPGLGKTWRNNFRLGIVDAIQSKLKEATDDLHDEMRTKAENDPVDPRRALVVLNNALKRREQVLEDAQTYGKENLRLVRTTRGSAGGAHDYSGRLAGREAGSSIHIGKARAGVGAGNKEDQIK